MSKKVMIIMGSDSDLPVMEKAVDVFSPNARRNTCCQHGY